MQKPWSQPEINGAQSRAARALLGLSQAELAGLCDLAASTIARLEGAAHELHISTLRHIEAVLRARGVALLVEKEWIGVEIDRSLANPPAAKGQIICAAQSRAARALLGISQRELVRISGIDKRVIDRLETGQTNVATEKLNRVRASLVVLGIMFVSHSVRIGVKVRAQNRLAVGKEIGS